MRAASQVRTQAGTVQPSSSSGNDVRRPPACSSRSRAVASPMDGAASPEPSSETTSAGGLAHQHSDESIGPTDVGRGRGEA
jgi:hypothetical protein